MSSLTNCRMSLCGREIDRAGEIHYEWNGGSICEKCYDNTDWYEEAIELQEENEKLREMTQMVSLQKIAENRRKLKEIESVYTNTVFQLIEGLDKSEIHLDFYRKMSEILESTEIGRVTGG